MVELRRLLRPLAGFGAAAAIVASLGVALPAIAAAQPTIASLSVLPRFLPSTGGRFTITAHVRDAASCTLSYPGLGASRTVACSSGGVSVRRTAPPNGGPAPRAWHVKLVARGFKGGVSVKRAVVDVEPPATPPVKGLDTCAPGPECAYGAAYESFQTWGNVAPNTLGDCTFAAAANWEQIVLGVHAEPTVIGYEFSQAGGTERGLAQNALWSYWERPGIAGIYLTGLNRYTTTREDVENSVRDYGALIAELQFVANDGFGEYEVAAGLHDVVVDGFTPEGPLAVSWGETIQMTWEQWDHEVLGMWGIGAS